LQTVSAASARFTSLPPLGWRAAASALVEVDRAALLVVLSGAAAVIALDIAENDLAS